MQTRVVLSINGSKPEILEKTFNLSDILSKETSVLIRSALKTQGFDTSLSEVAVMIKVKGVRKNAVIG